MLTKIRILSLGGVLGVSAALTVFAIRADARSGSSGSLSSDNDAGQKSQKTTGDASTKRSEVESGITPAPLKFDPKNWSAVEKPGSEVDDGSPPDSKDASKNSAKVTPGAREEKQNHPDGSIHFRVPLDSQGKRNGVYTAYYPGGKKNLEERSHYDHGELQGVLERYDEKHTLLVEQTWFHGRLIFPKSAQLIEAARRRTLADAVASVARLGPLSNPNSPSPDALAHTLANVNLFRFLCDVPADVGLDDEKISLAQDASELLGHIGHLTHTPDRPAGVSDKLFERGATGCVSSNLSIDRDIAAAIFGYMDDSDPSNIDRIGHRRWLLNPPMAQTGFGISGKFSAHWSIDESREKIPDYDYVCFPPRGYCPTNLFDGDYAWHVSVNPLKYDVQDDAKISLYPVDQKLHRAAHPLRLNFEHIDREPYGIPNAVIARPDAFKCEANAVYEVVVSGLLKDGKPAEINYFVSFY